MLFGSRVRVRLLVTAALIAAGAGIGVPLAAPAYAVDPIRESGYLSMGPDEQGVEIKLRYTVVRMPGAGPLPTLFEYSGYNPGDTPDDSYISQYVTNGAGYNYIGVNLRGTGCSTGTFDFFQPAEATDGKAVIDWIAQQPWSDGKVGMIGKSYPGITQLFVAAEQPAALKAIAPGHFFADAYRDVARPGGIVNYGFSTLWSFIARPSYETQTGPQEVAAGDPDCVSASTAEARGLPTNPFVQLLQHPYDDALVRERSPMRILDKLKTPMLATLSWQDEQLASRQTHLLSGLDDLNAARRAAGQPETPWWANLSNGDHGMARTTYGNAELRQFYDYFLKGKTSNGWATRPKVKVWWEAGRKDGDGANRLPAWVTGLSSWSEAQRSAAGQLTPWALALRSGGRLTTAPAAVGEAASTYLYTPAVGSEGLGNPYYGSPSLPNQYIWDQSPPDGTALHFTTAPFTQTRTFLGSASLDVWLSSTAPDTDLQVTLTEVRPDGQEVYVQKGWVRASQRALDPAKSTALRPYQTHQESDVELLTPLQAVPVRVEVFPFGHVVRAGSRLRVWIEAPTVLPELWSFVPFPTPAQNTVLHDATHPSRLVLPLVPNSMPAAFAAQPDCGDVIRQPCRVDPVTTSTEPEPVVPEVPWPAALPLVTLALFGLAVRIVRGGRRSAGSDATA